MQPSNNFNVFLKNFLNDDISCKYFLLLQEAFCSGTDWLLVTNVFHNTISFI